MIVTQIKYTEKKNMKNPTISDPLWPKWRIADCGGAGEQTQVTKE